MLGTHDNIFIKASTSDLYDPKSKKIRNMVVLDVIFNQMPV